MRFADRTDAGERLARALSHYRGQDVVVLALPRGGVPVAAIVARHLGASLDVLLVRKVGAPMQRELAMGAVLDGAHPVKVRNEEIIAQLGISQETFDDVCAGELAEIERRRKLYRADRSVVDIAGRTVILVDDGIATGSTVKAAISGLRQKGVAKIVLAIPLAPHETIECLKKDVEDVVCLAQPTPFCAISLHYDHFPQVSDDDVIRLLKEIA